MIALQNGSGTASGPAAATFALPITQVKRPAALSRLVPNSDANFEQREPEQRNVQGRKRSRTPCLHSAPARAHRVVTDSRAGDTCGREVACGNLVAVDIHRG